VWAATLALGEALDRSEDDILRAFVAGFEVSARVGSGLGPALTSRGFHATGSFGRIGAAAASAALLALDEDQIGHALGVAATQASGLGASFGTMAKPFHAGKAAMDGVLSAQLAADDFRGAPWILSASGGLDRAMIQDGSVKLGFDTSRPWQILHNSFKPYAACHLVHPSVDAGRKLGIDPSSIRGGRVFVSPLAMQITGGASGEPATPLAAKFDLRYCLALALHGHTLSAADFMEPWKLDPAIAATAVKLAPAADPNVGYAAARVEVDLPDGGMRTAEIATAKGHPANPMTWEDMRAKFEGLVARRLGNAGTAELLALVKDFGSGRALSQMQAILGRLAADAAPHGAQLARAAS
jgi:2-methylcitrate dehydratase PrpD